MEHLRSAEKLQTKTLSSTLNGAATATPNLTPIAAGPYAFRLTVTDGKGGSASADFSYAEQDRNAGTSGSRGESGGRV